MKPVSNENEAVAPAAGRKPVKLKYWLQITVVLGALAGVIGFITYVTQGARVVDELKPVNPNPVPDIEPIKYQYLDPPVREVEIFSENTQDYYFVNATSETASLRLAARGCTCVHTVEVATWPLREALGELLALASTSALDSLG